MSGDAELRSLPSMPSERLAVLGRLMREGEPAGVSRSARSLWWLLAVGYANASEGGRCRVSRAVVMQRIGLKASATAEAYRELIAAGWLEQIGRAYPGRVAEYRVVVPASIRARLGGGDRPERARSTGRKGPAGRRNGSAEPGAEQKGLTEQQQQQGGAAAGGVCDEQGKPSPAAEHPKVAAVLDRVGLVDAAARAEIAGMDGIELVIEDLGRRAAKGDNPPGLLRKLVREDAPTAIEQAGARVAASAQREAAEASARQQREDDKKMRAEAEGRLNAMSEAEREALRAEVMADQPEPTGKVRAKPSDALVRRWMIEELARAADQGG